MKQFYVNPANESLGSVSSATWYAWSCWSLPYFGPGVYGLNGCAIGVPFHSQCLVCCQVCPYYFTLIVGVPLGLPSRLCTWCAIRCALLQLLVLLGKCVRQITSSSQMAISHLSHVHRTTCDLWGNGLGALFYSEWNLEYIVFRHRVANLLSETFELSLVERARGS